MAFQRPVRWARDYLPKMAYLAMTGSGMIFIGIAKTNQWEAGLTIGIPIALMLSYFFMATVLGAFRVHDELAGDNLYYMGFLYTLSSLGAALYLYDSEGSVDGIVRDFGLAVATTICGIALRIAYNQVRRDPIDIERSARHELAEMTRRVRAELESASQEFANFRRVSNQMLEEGFEEIGLQAQKSGQQILKIMEGLSQDAIKPVNAAGDQIQVILSNVAKNTESCLNEATQRMEASSKTFEEANDRMTQTVHSFGEQVEAAGNKLAEVKMPEEIISIKLQPTLKALVKLVKTHGQRLEASDDDRERQIQAIKQTHQTVAQLASVVERSIAALDKAAETTAGSQRATENLARLIQNQNEDLRHYLEKIVNTPKQSISPRKIDEGSVMSGESTAPPLEERPEPKVQALPSEPYATSSSKGDTLQSHRDEEKRWWSRR